MKSISTSRTSATSSGAHRLRVLGPEHGKVLYSITKHAMRRSADEIGATSISFRPKVFSDPASVVDVHRQSRQPRESRSCFYPFLRDRHIEPTLPCRSVKASTRCWKHRVTAPRRCLLSPPGRMIHKILH